MTVALSLWLFPRISANKKTEVAISGISDRNPLQRKKLFSCLICMLPLLVVMSCRWGLGVDMWYTYAPGYLAIKSESTRLSEEEEEILKSCYELRVWMNREFGDDIQAIKALTLEQAYEEYYSDYHHTGIGFQLLERLLAYLQADVQWLLFTTSFLVLGLVFSSIWIQSTRPAWATLFFVITANFFVSLNVIAQYIAVAICLFACSLAEKRKLAWFYVLIAIAVSFHYSAIVFLPVYFLPKLKIRPRWCVLLVAFSLIISQFSYPLVRQLVLWLAPKYQNYIDGVVGGNEFEWIFMAINCAVFVLGTFYYEKGKNLPYYRLWYNLNVLAMITLAFSGVVPWIKRINYYFAAPHFLFIPLALSLEDHPIRRKVFHGVTVLLFCAEIYVAICVMNKHGTLPYHAFFQGDRVRWLQSMLNWI